MKVLFNTYPVAFDCIGGGEIQLLESKAALEQLGADVLLYNSWNPQLRQSDVVHYFSVQGGSMNFCAYAKGLGLPLLISPILWLTEENINSYPIEEIRDLLHLCDVILPNSEAEKHLLVDFFHVSPKKFFVIPNAVNRSFGIPVPADLFRARFHVREQYLLNVANIEPRKNQLSLIRAARGLGLTVIIAGGVRDSAYYDACMREGSGFVRHVGFLDHEGGLLKSAYTGCDAFLLPSLLETPGLAALEAASQGCRVVVTSVGSTQEYFHDLVTYVNPYDVDDIRAGIQMALRQPPDDTLRHYMLKTFTWDRAARKLLEAYELVNKWYTFQGQV